MTVEEICRDLPNLWPEDVSESLRYAAKAVRERQLAAAPIGVRLLLDDNLPCGLSVGKLGLECAATPGVPAARVPEASHRPDSLGSS